MIQRRPHCSATVAVVPEPQVGSSTRSPTAYSPATAPTDATDSTVTGTASPLVRDVVRTVLRKEGKRVRERSALERDQDSGDQKSADHKEQRDAIDAPPEARAIAVHQKHSQEREEPKSVDLFAMIQRLHVT